MGKSTPPSRSSLATQTSIHLTAYLWLFHRSSKAFTVLGALLLSSLLLSHSLPLVHIPRYLHILHILYPISYISYFVRAYITTYIHIYYLFLHSHTPPTAESGRWPGLPVDGIPSDQSRARVIKQNTSATCYCLHYLDIQLCNSPQPTALPASSIPTFFHPTTTQSHSYPALSFSTHSTSCSILSLPFVPFYTSRVPSRSL
ncbi:hypothetical protein F4820DRAFT_331523 [Hypoxylon rubiginosum]|uniref:Uncharacterized protein n=1 Tax=Hypoxylon rubiginosum TaxID=110542 RepID=A0ACB9YZN0_9PEZI|nr:hypothetical protein F4820DRAFT_331523 [Hypoxylon rubiginosum]